MGRTTTIDMSKVAVLCLSFSWADLARKLMGMALAGCLIKDRSLDEFTGSNLSHFVHYRATSPFCVKLSSPPPPLKKRRRKQKGKYFTMCRGILRRNDVRIWHRTMVACIFGSSTKGFFEISWIYYLTFISIM